MSIRSRRLPTPKLPSVACSISSGALGLPVIDRSSRRDQRGVTFELLSSRGRNVITGHDSGVITLDLSESDDAHREFVRQQLGEPYRTVLGHLRHEIGHYYWPSLRQSAPAIVSRRFARCFGDERLDLRATPSSSYYAPASTMTTGRTRHVSRYATMHPWEDWAETFAHYLHIDAGLTTADVDRADGRRARPVGRSSGVVDT